MGKSDSNLLLLSPKNEDQEEEGLMVQNRSGNIDGQRTNMSKTMNDMSKDVNQRSKSQSHQQDGRIAAPLRESVSSDGAGIQI